VNFDSVNFDSVETITAWVAGTRPTLDGLDP
jgi:hypothetical protein